MEMRILSPYVLVHQIKNINCLYHRLEVSGQLNSTLSSLSRNSHFSPIRITGLKTSSTRNLTTFPNSNSQSKSVIFNENRWRNYRYLHLPIQQHQKSQKHPMEQTTSAAIQKPTTNDDKSNAVIFHIVPRGITLPNPSPFAMKLWTYLNMAEIPFKIDTKNSFSSKGKTPWITVDGVDVADSQICIEYLGKKFKKDLSASFSAEQLGISRAARIMLEDHGYWGMALWRVNQGRGDNRKVYKLANTIPVKIFFDIIFLGRVKRAAWGQGMGRHSDEEVQDLMYRDLRAVSAILGQKKFILGDTACEDDCGIFGCLSQVKWGLPNSPYEKMLKEEFTNLDDYCERMKSTYWSNWNQELAR